MRELRILMVMVPPLLVDLVRHIVGDRLGLSGVTLEVVDRIAEDLSDAPPDLMIIDQNTAPLAFLTKSLSGPTKVLIMSADHTVIFGPGPNDVAPLTPQSLATHILNISQ